MILSSVLAGLAVVSVILLLWQWAVALRFPLHERVSSERSGSALMPGISVLKPLKGYDHFTEKCLRSWLEQEYRGSVQVLFGVASAKDPVCDIVHKILTAFPKKDARLVICGPAIGANPKVSTLIELERAALHSILVISDADVRVPPDFLTNIITPLHDHHVGLVNCFYRLANPLTAAMQCEAVAINADFWSQVLQARSLKPLDFALGAVVATRRETLRQIGGFHSLVDTLADDYQLGNRIARNRKRVEFASVVAECWSEPMDWDAVWKHQLRWARTIRVCQPVPYFFSILGNATFWPYVWLLANPGPMTASFFGSALLLRLASAWQLQSRLIGPASDVPEESPPSRARFWWMPVLKDVLHVGVWAGAFLGNTIEWRGQRMRLRSDGTLVGAKESVAPRKSKRKVRRDE